MRKSQAVAALRGVNKYVKDLILREFDPAAQWDLTFMGGGGGRENTIGEYYDTVTTIICGYGFSPHAEEEDPDSEGKYFFQISLGVTLKRNQAPMLAIMDSNIPSWWQRRGLYSAAVKKLLSYPGMDDITCMWVHGSMNDAAWIGIAKKFNLDWYNDDPLDTSGAMFKHKRSVAHYRKTAGGKFFDKDGNPLTPEQIEEFVKIAYKGMEVIFTGEGLRNEADGWYVGVDDNDPGKFHWFFCYKKTPFGKKMFSVGHDGDRASIREMLQFKSAIMQDPSEHCYVEASGRPEKLYETWGIPKVPADEVSKFLPGKQIHPIDQYHYERVIGGSNKVKVMFGYPVGLQAHAASRHFTASLLQNHFMPCWQEEP